MPPKNNNNNNIVTLDDIRKRHQFDGAAGTNNAAAAIRSTEYPKDNHKNNSIFGSSNNNYCKPIDNGHGPPIPLYVIPSLAQSETCRQLFQRVHDEFVPIVRRRGYTITSISELCCCGDGLDFVSSKKCRKMNKNVWGYNQTTMFRKTKGSSTTTARNTTVHSIHLRLRQPNHHHRFLSYEDVAGTMAHELSHCVHQNHGKAFYALMEEILEEHALLQAQKLSSSTLLTTTTTTTINVNGSGHRLGGGGGGGTSRLLDGNKLGGQKGKQKAQSQRELAARAAESRKRQLQQIRRMIERSKEPCIIEIFDDDDDNDDEVVIVDKIDNDVVEIIDNVNIDNVNAAQIDNDVVEIIEPKVPNRKRKSGNQNQTKQPQTAKANAVIDLTMSMNGWLCGLCTYQNRASASLCEMCHGPR